MQNKRLLVCSKLASGTLLGVCSIAVKNYTRQGNKLHKFLHCFNEYSITEHAGKTAIIVKCMLIIVLKLQKKVVNTW